MLTSASNARFRPARAQSMLFMLLLFIIASPAFAATFTLTSTGPAYKEAIEVGVVPRKAGVIAGSQVLGRENYGIGKGFTSTEIGGDYYDFYLEFQNYGPSAARRDGRSTE